MMQGLLGQGWEDPRSQMNMALAAGLLKGDLGGGLLAGNQAYQQGLLAKRQQEMDGKRMGLLDAQLSETLAQTQERQANARKVQAALELQERQRRELPGLFRQPGMTGGEAQPQSLGGVPMFSQPMRAAPMQQTPGSFDVQRAVALGLDPDLIAKYANLPNLGRPEVARTQEMDDGRGGKMTVQLDKFGQRVGDGMPGYIAPVQVNQGDRVTFTRPTAGAAFPVNLSPSERDASARGWAGLTETKRHNSVTEGNSVAGRVPPGYRMKPDGTMEAIPGGPAAAKASEQVAGSRKALDIINQAQTLIDGATGSYIGAAGDQVARAFGGSTDGAENIAQLEALEGALMMAQPRMEGPQSNLDVQLYRQMAAQIGDSTVPRGTKKAALDTVRALHEKYAGMQPGESRPRPPGPSSMEAPVPTLRWNPKTQKLEAVGS